MAINEIIKGAIRRVSDAIDGGKPDTARLRRHLSERGADCLNAIESGSFDDPWLSAADEQTVAFSPATADGQPLLVNGKSTTFWPRGQIANAVSSFQTAVNDGRFDDQLLSRGAPSVSPKVEGEQRPEDTENGSMSTGGGRTDESEVETRFTEHLRDRAPPVGG